MLDAKGVVYERIDLIPAWSRVWLRLSGFRSGRVPALRLDGVRTDGSRAIARALDALRPEPPFFPSEPHARARVEAIEAWGDGPLQDVARRIVLWALTRDRAALRAALEGARLQFPLPLGLAASLARPVVRLDAALNGAHADAVRSDLASLPAMLDRIDAWIERGDLGGSPATAADYQVAGSVRMLLTLEDLTAVTDDRPAAFLARRLIPAYPGRVRAGTLPRSWLGR